MQRHLVIVLPALAVVSLATAANHGSTTNQWRVTFRF